MTIRIILADDHPIFRDGLVRSLTSDPSFDVVGVGGSADEAVALVEKHAPDIALLDVSMPGHGITAARRIAAMETAAKVVMLTVSEEDETVMQAIEAGAKGYVLKGIGAEELRVILSGIAAGQAHISPALAARVLQAMKAPPKVPEKRPIDELTHREEQILKRVATGMSNAEVARDLNLQEKTVKHYMTTILSKLHAKNRVEAALIARDAWDKP